MKKLALAALVRGECHHRGGSTPSHEADAARYVAARVTRVVDGDTIVVRTGSGATRTVRLIGIDAPEMTCCPARSTKWVLAQPRRRQVDQVDPPAPAMTTIVTDAFFVTWMFARTGSGSTADGG